MLTVSERQSVTHLKHQHTRNFCSYNSHYWIFITTKWSKKRYYAQDCHSSPLTLFVFFGEKVALLNAFWTCGIVFRALSKPKICEAEVPAAAPPVLKDCLAFCLAWFHHLIWLDWLDPLTPYSIQGKWRAFTIDQKPKKARPHIDLMDFFGKVKSMMSFILYWPFRRIHQHQSTWITLKPSP